MPRTISFCLLILVAASTAHADEVRLKNGDRITGVTTLLDGGVLTFKAANGELKIPWTDVMSLTVVEPMLVTSGPHRQRPPSSPLRTDRGAPR